MEVLLRVIASARRVAVLRRECSGVQDASGVQTDL